MEQSREADLTKRIPLIHGDGWAVFFCRDGVKGSQDDRIGQGKKIEKESECRGDSDSTKSKNRKEVRMQATFGLGKN
ncbi:hypothetical protein [Ammoniphilus sp. YIM 78166]|uniref:hypothetical protein n=1 Tax=Ammoniphilus sp. YIM 78166 TaxID=1644106 RepID=UPI00142FCF65|nr:hypothetical protein [Ammoniphilus sp. YIM 78166]